MKLSEIIEASHDPQAENSYLRDCFREGDPRIEIIIKEKTARENGRIKRTSVTLAACLPPNVAELECFRLECEFDSVWNEQPLIVELIDRKLLVLAFSLGEFKRNNARAIGILAKTGPIDLGWMKYMRRWHTYKLSPERDGFREVFTSPSARPDGGSSPSK